MVATRVVASPKSIHDFSVDLDTPFENDLFRFAGAGDARLGENLLQAIALGLVVRFRFGGSGRLRHGISLPTAELLIAVEYVESLLSPLSPKAACDHTVRERK